MKKLTTQILFERLFRHQIYLEGVKRNLAYTFDDVMKQVYASVTQAIIHYRYDKMNQLTKAQLAMLLALLQREQQAIYSQYAQKLLALLKRFVAVESQMTNAIYNNTLDDVPNDELWSSVTEEPVPANGLLLKDYVTNFVGNMNMLVLNAIRQGYANSWSLPDTLQYIGGTDKQTGVLDRFNNQQAVMSGTLLQHSSAVAQAALASTKFSEYQWISILDSRTTEICQERAGKIYRYADGPQPPAHYNCRSKTVPIVGTSDLAVPATLFAWSLLQSSSFLQDAFAKVPASGTTLSTANIKALTVEQFSTKTNLILGD